MFHRNVSRLREEWKEGGERGEWGYTDSPNVIFTTIATNLTI